MIRNRNIKKEKKRIKLIEIWKMELNLNGSKGKNKHVLKQEIKIAIIYNM